MGKQSSCRYSESAGGGSSGSGRPQWQAAEEKKFLCFFREEVDADSVNLMAMGACGAFIHGLEDEFLAVRSATIDALTFLCTKNAKLANLALDCLVDMFNDEIESVRLKAIEALTIIADHICLQVKRFYVRQFLL